jgi:hypothetical protein
MESQLGPFILCAFISLIGLGLILIGAFDLHKASRAKTWPTAEGRILSSSLRERNDGEGTSYEVAILYEYFVNGRAHRSDVWRVRPGSSSFTKAATAAVERYPVGAAVTVYFNPEDPADAMLEPGKISWSLIFGGLAFAGSGVMGFVHLLRGVDM